MIFLKIIGCILGVLGGCVLIYAAADYFGYTDHHWGDDDDE